MFIEVILGILAALFVYQAFFKKDRPADNNGYVAVPVVNKKWPLVGHGIAFSKDIPGFIEKCYNDYGKVFQIKIFRRNMVVICDRTLVKEYFKLKESQMSMYNVLSDLYFADAFSDNPNSLPDIITMIKKTIAVRFNEFVPKIEAEARQMIKKLLDTADNKPVRLADEMIRFVARTSARCFINVELPEDVFVVLMQFTNLLNRIVVWTYFLPKKWIRFLMQKKLSAYRKQITRYLEPEIEKYRKDLGKNDSMVFRSAVDYVGDNGRCFTNQEIGDIVVCLLYVSSENTALGLAATVTDLAKSPEWWKRVKKESKLYLEKGDIAGLFKSELIDNCVKESARMNTHIFPLNRKPASVTTIGEFDVRDVDTVAICEPMLMCSDALASDIFKNPREYNPNRFSKPQNEKKTPLQVMTWGASVHLCPGKQFAIYEIKMALALLTTHLKIEIPAELPPLNYFSPSAFAERQVMAKLTPLDLGKEDIQLSGNVKVTYFHNGGWLIKNYINTEEQIDLYQNLLDISRHSEEQKEMVNIPAQIPYPLAYYNLVYTNSSNCDLPERWLNLGQQLINIFNENRILLHLDEHDVDETFRRTCCDSLYAQLYSRESVMALHKDKYVSWGISINLGASCEFVFGSHSIILESGDVFIADFSKTDHAVTRIIDATTPIWYTDDKNLDRQTFGRCRCSVQLRDLSKSVNVPVMDIESFKHTLVDGKALISLQ